MADYRWRDTHTHTHKRTHTLHRVRVRVLHDGGERGVSGQCGVRRAEAV